MNKMIKKIFRYETTFVPKGLSLGFGVVAFGFVIAITLYHLSYQNSNLMRYMLAVPVIFLQHHLSYKYCIIQNQKLFQ